MNNSLSASNPVTLGQKSELVRIATDMARKAVVVAVDKLVDSGMIQNPTIQTNVIERASFAEDLFGLLQTVIETKLVSETRSWQEKDGVIYLSVISNGMTGPQWIVYFEKKGIQLSKWAKDVLNSKDFKPTKGVVYKIAILKGMLFEDNNRITKKIRAEADKRKLTTPNAEVACLIRDNFSDEDIEAMGLTWIIIMHEPIKDSGGDPRLLSADRRDDGQWLGTFYDEPGRRWVRESGFAFVVSQVVL